MEDFADKIVYIIIGLIVLVVNFATKAKKQAEKPIFQPFDEDVFHEEKESQSQEIIVDESLNSQELILTDETQYYKEIKKEILQEKSTKSNQKSHSELEDFDLRKAVIYSEILNRKY